MLNSLDKRILHVDMDAFFASVEQAVNPALRNKPVIVGGRPEKRRTVVCAASYEAKKYGIDSGMSCQEAFRLCPQAEFVVADSAKYIYVSRQIAILLNDFSPQVEPASVDEFYLDVTGQDRVFGSFEALGQEMRARIRKKFKITGSVGISVNRLLSKIASKLKKPDGLVVLEPENISKVLAALPVHKVPGIGPSLSRQLNELSIFTFSDLEKKPRDFLVECFGKIGIWMHGIARPEEVAEEEIASSISPREQPKSVGHSYTLPKNIYDDIETRSWIRFLCEMVAARLRRYALESKTLHFYWRRWDFKFYGKEKNFNDYTNDPEDLYQRAVFIFDQIKRDKSGIRAMGVIARSLMPEAGTFLFPSQERRSRILKTQDRINEKFGEWTVYPASIFNVK